MSADPPSLTRIGVRFLLTLAAVMVLWIVFLEPGYDRFIATVGVQVLRLVESPRITAAVRMDDQHAVVSHAEPYSELEVQRLDLRTHHNNAPLLVALILATPGLSRSRRERILIVGMVLLAVTHVLHFMLEVHWSYAFANIGPYRVTDLHYFHRGIWQSLDNRAQVAKLLVNFARNFYASVGRLFVPILLWMILCHDVLRSAIMSAGPPEGPGERAG